MGVWEAWRKGIDGCLGKDSNSGLFSTRRWLSQLARTASCMSGSAFMGCSEYQVEVHFFNVE